MLSGMLGKLKEMGNGLKDDALKFKNRGFMEACTAGCAIIANADGVVKPEEKRKMMGFMGASDVLSLYDTTTVIASFEKHCAKYDFDAQIGEAEALKVVSTLKSKPAEARLLVRACCVIAGSDGNFDQDERAAVTRMCHELGLDASEFLPAA
ncbi:MAG: tellurite resistance TerB family protein [Thiocapsa sp.]|uniref:tellurite resistance TerB family protein n=1 Tax=Thiocapsa sp. TaxID=2024551 RepID=UPI001BD17A8A|nr:tellurite resistance TerB family protein [Thiocapsa sp.]QVL47731.1 MAG: tellurite resistance TerB family protein [Thiocapsa sp.]